mmetsp:Transcript_144696/g.463653  ORF Transcript_144696/g.463653 Transcript_144696/m.463653 type:complete len:278 (+) Transcript_144696:4386-5219(+)
MPRGLRLASKSYMPGWLVGQLGSLLLSLPHSRRPWAGEPRSGFTLLSGRSHHAWVDLHLSVRRGLRDGCRGSVRQRQSAAGNILVRAASVIHVRACERGARHFRKGWCCLFRHRAWRILHGVLYRELSKGRGSAMLEWYMEQPLSGLARAVWRAAARAQRQHLRHMSGCRRFPVCHRVWRWLWAQQHLRLRVWGRRRVGLGRQVHRPALRLPTEACARPPRLQRRPLGGGSLRGALRRGLRPSGHLGVCRQPQWCHVLGADDAGGQRGPIVRRSALP